MLSLFRSLPHQVDKRKAQKYTPPMPDVKKHRCDFGYSFGNPGWEKGWCKSHATKLYSGVNWWLCRKHYKVCSKKKIPIRDTCRFRMDYTPPKWTTTISLKQSKSSMPLHLFLDKSTESTSTQIGICLSILGSSKAPKWRSFQSAYSNSCACANVIWWRWKISRWHPRPDSWLALLKKELDTP